MKLVTLFHLLIAVPWLGTLPAQELPRPSAMPDPPDGWVARTWQTEDGLPQNAVNAVLQARDGFLWVGTNGGLARFDGVQFRRFGLHEGLRSVVIMALAEDRQGTVWAGTSGGGLSCWEKGRFSSFGVEEGFPFGTDVLTLAGDRDGSLWIGTGEGLIRRRDGGFEIIGEAQGLPRKQIRAVLQDVRGTLWVSVILDGLYRGENGKFVRESAPVGTVPGIYCLLEDRDGSIWAGADSGVLWMRRHGTWQPWGPDHGIPRANLQCLAQQSDGRIWVGTLGGGLHRSAGARFSPVGGQGRDSSRTVRALTVDREGSVWAGTIGGGLERWSPRVLENHGPEDGLPESRISSVTEDGAGLLWVGTATSGIYLSGNGRFSRLEDPAVPENYPFFYCTAVTADGSVWAAGEQCLYRFRAGEPTSAFLEAPVRGRAVRALCAYGDTLWAGTYDAALLKFDAAGLVVAAPTGTFPGGITSIVCETADTLWIGTSGGLHRWHQGELRTWTTRDGLLTASVRALHRDPDGTLWIGTLGGGLACLKDGRVVNITTRQGLINDVISQIMADDSGNLWLGCDRGIMRLARQELDAFIRGAIRSVNPMVFGRSEGMSSEQCSGGYSPTVCKTRDGRLFFPTVRNIVEINPRRLRNAAVIAPLPTIESLLVDYQPQDMATRLVIPPGQHRIEISFTAPVLQGGEWVRFRHRLEGLDRDWVMAGSNRVASYDGLPPGDFRFQVAAADDKGNWGAPASGLAFTVQPHYWETPWFRAGGVLLLAGASGAAALGHQRRKHRKQLEVLEQERRMQAEMTHLSRVSSLAQLSGSLAHELNQPLGIILSNAQAAQRMLGQGDPDLEELRSILTDIVDEDRRAGEVIKRLRALLKRGETCMAPVSPNAIIEDVLRLLRSDLMSRGVAVQTDLDPGLPDIQGDQIQLQQVLMNLITNGCDAMADQPSGEKVIRISSRQQPHGIVVISVEDQGCGVPGGDHSSIFQPFFTTKSHGMGIGLSICRSIVAAHHGLLHAVPNPGKGTTFHLELKTGHPLPA